MFCPHHPLCPEAPVLPEAGGTRSSWFCPGQHGRRPGLHEPANLTDHDTGVVVYLSSQNLTDHWRRRVLIEPIPTQIIALCASSERGGLGERKREIDRRARQQASAHSSPDSHPEGQYRTTLHRGPAPCMLLRLDALAAHVAAVACMRSTSLAAAPARAVAGRPLSAALSLSLCNSSLSCTSISTAASLAHVACRHLCSARARMREKVR